MEVEVTVQTMLAPGEPQGHFTLVTSENNTIAGLIRKLCTENGMVMKSTYAVRDTNNTVLRWSQNLRECGVVSGSILYLSDNAEEAVLKPGLQCNTWWLMAGLSLLIGGIGLAAVAIMYTRGGTVVYDYGVVLDAGSSHTKLFVYNWNGAKCNETGVVKQVSDCIVNGPGISSYETNIDDLVVPLQKCLDEAKSAVPTDQQSGTPVFLGATAGMRLLHEVNNTVSDAILKTVRDTIKKYPFKFDNPERQAKIITGMEEGTFSWITSNYITGRFGVQTPRSSSGLKESTLANGHGTLGALDMGGASTQITFYPEEEDKVPEKFRRDMTLYGLNYTVYTHSYLCYGINEAIRRYKAALVVSQNYSTTIQNPCGPKGNETLEEFIDVFEAPCTKGPKAVESFGFEILPDYSVDKNATFVFEGTSDPAHCEQIVESSLFNLTAECHFPSCSFNGVFQPPVYGDFYAFSSFYYLADFLSLSKRNSTLTDFTTAITSLCNMSWSQVKDMKTSKTDFLPWYCFEGQFALTLLTKGYKFNSSNWDAIKFVNKIKGTDIGWSLGYMIDSSTLIPENLPQDVISTVAFSLLVILFTVFILLAVGFACHAHRHQVRKKGLYEPLSSYGSV